MLNPEQYEQLSGLIAKTKETATEVRTLYLNQTEEQSTYRSNSTEYNQTRDIALTLADAWVELTDAATALEALRLRLTKQPAEPVTII
ncbi:hypothetical protein GCM10028806_33190 [Spirosoma terrae]|uniref:Uncharacterized protein n=1 Tax=Spirosoma terrae TaxID=1968276 RepID=A0A6L9LA04_9BACT|nr:hypothetical protein [Spirosoma terrae]NDU95633.1 hypothetical protein [Spirosoma terrae]